MLKRLVAVLAVLTMSAAACGGESEPAGTDAPVVSSSASTTSVAPTSVPETSSTAPAAAETVVSPTSSTTSAVVSTSSTTTTTAVVSTTSISEVEQPSTVPAAAEPPTGLLVAAVNGETIGVEDMARLVPAAGEAMPPEQFAAVLASVILSRIAVGEAERRFGLSLTEEELEAAVTEIAGPPGEDRRRFLDEEGLTEEGLNYFLTSQVLFERIADALVAEAPEPAEEELREIYDSNLDFYTSVCSYHILLETEEEGMAALERARGGEDFADLARELSTGPSGPGGGELGCTTPNSYVPEFAAAVSEAPLGEPVGPVETQFGWHVILVSERNVPSFEEMREVVTAEYMGNAIDEWWDGAVAAAEVTVEPEYGQWTPGPPYVIPPAEAPGE